MEKFIPYEKRSKKEKRKYDAMRRGTWGVLNPVTRKSENPKAYNRRKARKWIDDPLSVPFAFSGKCARVRIAPPVPIPVRGGQRRTCDGRYLKNY